MSFLGVVIISMVFAIYLFVFEKSPVTYLNIPFPVSEDRDYKTGDSIQFLVERCVSYPVKYTVTRVLVNDDLNAKVSRSYLPSTDVNAGGAGSTGGAAPGAGIQPGGGGGGSELANSGAGALGQMIVTVF